MKELAGLDYCPSIVAWGYPSKSIKADVLFGAPSKDCSGVGICRIGLRGTFNEEWNKCKAAAVEISLTNDKKLQLKFGIDTMCLRIKKVHFRHDYFRIQENFMLPDFVNKALGLKDKYIFKSGRYKVQVTAKNFSVVF